MTMQYKNPELAETVRLAKEQGYRVFTYQTQRNQPISYVILVDDVNNRIGSAQAAEWGGVQFGTIHKPSKEIGTGFGQLIAGQETNQPKDFHICFNRTAYWWTGDTQPIKYKGIEEYTKANRVLRYYEITELTRL